MYYSTISGRPVSVAFCEAGYSNEHVHEEEESTDKEDAKTKVKQSLCNT